ncbi:hypothetical protein KGP36_02635 [Patescibacteria group bacterium]|nr:hypothetical protein [Patescibacteria group bacterium]
MSAVLDYVRSKDPRLKDVGDDELTLYLADKKPDFLKDSDFKSEFERVVAKKSVDLAQRGIGGFLKVLTNPAAGEAAQAGREQIEAERAEPKFITPRQPATGEMSTTYGGPPKHVAGFRETIAPVEEELSNPRITAPRFTISPKDNPALAIGKEAVNIALGVPEFFTSTAGIASAVTGAVAPVATAGAFTADMLNSLGQQIQETHKNWTQLDRNQKLKAITDIAGTGVFAALLGHGTYRGIRPKAGTVAPGQEPTIHTPPQDPQQQLKNAAKNAEPVAPMTAAAVEEQAKGEPRFLQEGTEDLSTRPFITQGTPKTPQESPEAKSGVLTQSEPEKPQATPKAQEGTPSESAVTSDRITAASYTNPETGKTTTGENHIEAANAQGVKAPKIPTERHGDEYGFEVINTETGEKRYVSRDEAELIARANGQLLNEPQRGALHSDEVEFYKPKPKEENASEVSPTAAVHGDVQPQPGEGSREVPKPQSSGGVQPQAEGGLSEAQKSEASEKPDVAFPKRPESILTKTKGLKGKALKDAFAEEREKWKKYDEDLKAWEAAQPQNKGIVFRSDTGTHYAVTRDPGGGWRVTTFSKLFKDDQRLAPWGHELFPSRYEALKSVARFGNELTDKLPEIMTEEDISQRNKHNERDRIKEQFQKALSTESMKGDKTAGVNVYSDDRGIHSIGNPQDIFSGGKAPEGLKVSTVGVNGMTGELRLDQSTWGEGVDKAKIIDQLKDAGLKEESPAQSSDAPPEQSALAGGTGGTVAPPEKKGKTRVSIASGSRRRFAAETQLNGPDILSWMEENMKMLSKSAAKRLWGKDKFQANKSLWDDSAPLERPHHNIVFDDSGEPPDRVAQAAYEAGYLKEPSVNELHAAMQAASKARSNAFATAKREEAFMAEEAKQHEDWLKATAEGEERVSADQLKVGDMMEVDGERVEVTGVDADTGDVTLKDGRKFGTQKISEGQSIHVEKYEPTKEEDIGFGTEPEPEPQPEPKPEPDKAPETPPSEPTKPAVEPKPKVQERALTKAEQDEFQDLSIKARRAREEGGEPLTTEETKRYDELTSAAGQFELLGEDSPSGIKSRISQLKEKVDQLERLRVRTQERAFESRHRRDELFKEAVTYDNEAKKIREEIRELEKQLPKEEPKVEAKGEQPKSEHYQGPGDLNPPKFATGTMVVAGEGATAREGEIAGTGPKKPGEEQTYFVKTNLGEVLYPESKLKEKPPKPVTPQTSATAITEPSQKYRIKNAGPQLHTLVERLPASEVEIANGEQPVRIKNEKTGEESVVLEAQLQPVKERSAEERAASKGPTKKELDDELRRLGMDPSSFKSMGEKKEAIRRAKLKGPGSPSVYQGPDPKAQIEQLEESFRNIEGKKVPLGQKIKEAFDVGEKLAAGKDAVSRAVAGLKSTGDYIIRQWKGYDTLDDLKRAKGELSAEVEMRGWRVRKFAKQVLKAIPDRGQRAAIAKWVDAGGDQNELHWGFMQTTPEYQQAYADAMHLSGDALTAAQNIRNFFESRLQEAIDAGVLESGVDDYIHRIYEKDPKMAQQMAAYAQSGILSRNPSLAKKRIFQLDWEAERLGFRPVQDFLPRITAYETSLSRAIAARNFVKRVIGFTDENGNKISGLRAQDGRPIIDVAGLGVPIENEEGVREATLINPSFKPRETNNPLNERSDYKERPEYSALRKWKWATTDAEGKPIYVQGNVVIHPQYVERIDALLKPSSLRFTENKVKRGLFRTAIGVSSTVKQTMLDFSGFHQVQIAVHALEHRVNPLNLEKDIDFTNPDVDGLMKGGVTLGGEYREAHAGEGLVGRSVSRLIPGLSDVMQSYHDYLFQDFIPRIKMTMALHALERNKVRFKDELASGKLKTDEVYHMTANQANAAFGELNYTMLERSKTAQDLSRIIALAPDFLEARGRFVAQAFTKHGNEQRTALILGALTMYAIARVGNQLLDGQPHLEPENLFSMVYKGKSYSLRTVQGDILHLIDKPVQFWMSRLNPVYGRTMLEMATGRDYFGRKRSALEQIWDGVSTMMPVSLRSSRERSIWESIANGMGINARRYSDTDEAFKLAQKWKDQHGVGMKSEFIYDSNKDPLRPLKLAISNADDAGATREIKNLVDSKKYTVSKLNDYFSRYAAMPFTGSQENDRKFVQTLDSDQKKTVEAAREHKKTIRSLYQKAREKYFAALHSKPERAQTAPPEDADQPETNPEPALAPSP